MLEHLERFKGLAPGHLIFRGGEPSTGLGVLRLGQQELEGFITAIPSQISTRLEDVGDHHAGLARVIGEGRCARGRCRGIDSGDADARRVLHVR